MHRILFCCLLSSWSFLLNGQDTISYQVWQDLSYLPTPEVEVDSTQCLNLVIPETNEPAPLLVWVGGGAWSYVNKDVEMNLARRLAKEGIAVASVGHRLSPAVWRNPAWDKGVQHPAHVRDLAAAIHWLYEHAGEYGYDRDRLYVGGFSSGAQLTALLALDPKLLGEVGLSTDIIKGVIPISGTYDIEDYHQVFVDSENPAMAKQHVEAVFGESREDWRDASPVRFLDNLSAPWLVMCDNSLYQYTRLLEDRLRETNFREVQVVYAYHLSHAGLWRDMSNNPESVYRELVVRFIKK